MFFGKSNLEWYSMSNFVHIGCLNIYGTHVTANTSPNNKILFFFVSDLKIV